MAPCSIRHRPRRAPKLRFSVQVVLEGAQGSFRALQSRGGALPGAVWGRRRNPEPSLGGALRGSRSSNTTAQQPELPFSVQGHSDGLSRALRSLAPTTTLLPSVSEDC